MKQISMAKFSFNNFGKRKLTFFAAGVLMSVVAVSAFIYIGWQMIAGWGSILSGNQTKESGAIRFEIEKSEGAVN